MPQPILRDISFALAATLLEAILLFYLIRRKLVRLYPAFFLYIVAVILQSCLWRGAQWYWYPLERPPWTIYWSSQAVVMFVRWLAIAEIARQVFADYSGIRKMATRILIVLGICVLLYALMFSRFVWSLMVLNADRAVELCIATLVVGMFLFARYYRLPILKLERQLAVGFCLYSVSRVVKDSFLEHWHGTHWDFLNYVNVVAFLASLLLWIGAVRAAPEARDLLVPGRLSPERYGELSAKLNSRLQLLNNRLGHMFHSGDSRP
jgi:hypothetical protein